jgi:CheY-like chemotaxis protein
MPWERLMTEATRVALANRRILVAEDEFLGRMLLEEILAELRVVVVGSVGSIAALLDAVGANRPDAVTLDVDLRGERAYAAALSLQERGIPFVFVTGYAVLHDCPPSLSDVPRVNKPVTARELSAALVQVLAKCGPG